MNRRGAIPLASLDVFDSGEVPAAHHFVHRGTLVVDKISLEQRVAT